MKDWKQPVSPQIYSMSNGVSQQLRTSNPGMTLLDYFAGQVLQSITFEYIQVNMLSEQIAKDCYRIAQAMIVERAKVIADLEGQNNKA